MDQSAGPSVFKNPIPDINPSEVKKDTSNWFRKNLVGIIIVILVAAVAFELAFGWKSLFSPSGFNNLNIPAPKAKNLTEASISLVPDKQSYAVGDLVGINVELSTGGQTTDSTDLVVKYDPEFLSPIEKDFAAKGSIYSEYPGIQADREQGLIGISGITVPGGDNSFTGDGIFATIYFTALKNGQTTISVDFEKGQTADSNVVLTGSTQDILGSVKNADIVVISTK